MKIFYKARLIAEEDGLIVWIDKYYPIKETPCYYYCVDEFHNKINLKNPPIKKIHKTSSRFAFDSKDKAIEHLRFMKRRQLKHMEREAAFINSFLDCDNLKSCYNGMEVPNTRELVSKYLRFD